MVIAAVLLQSHALYFRIPPTVGVQEAKRASGREPDAERATVCQFYSPPHRGEIALNTSQHTYMLPHSGQILQQQLHSSQLT